MPVISFNHADPADFARAFGEFVHLVEVELTRLNTEVEILARIVQGTAYIEDIALLQNLPIDGRRSSFVREMAQGLADNLGRAGEPQALKVLQVLTQPAESTRPKLAVVGGTDTAPAASQSDGVQELHPIACPLAQGAAPLTAGDPTTT